MAAYTASKAGVEALASALSSEVRGLRCLGEGGFAVLTGRWRTRHSITASPRKIGDIVQAALVLTHFEHGEIT